MTRLLISFLLLFAVGSSSAQEDDCSRTATFGDVDICLPLIVGYTEGYLNPYVQPIADATEAPMNDVLGFYLNNATFNNRESLGSFSFDDYFKVYGTKEMQEVATDKAMLVEMSEMMNSNFVAKNWDELMEQSGPLAAQIDIGAPVVVDHYKLNDRSFSSIMLVKYQVDAEHSFLMSMCINGLQINNRLVWMAYYLEYADDETIVKLRAGNDKILNSILAAND